MNIRTLTEKNEIEILERLENAGFEGYFVGGCVREAVRKEQASAAGTLGVKGEYTPRETDTDIATDALPAQVKAVFQDMTVIDTGIKHGTVTVLFPVDAEPGLQNEDDDIKPAVVPVEITTYRIDGDYKDNRHPDDVKFTSSITEDLARRDFTVNAIACSRNGDLIDPFGGVIDIEAGIIRAVGEPEKRFREDGLRIIRALRFAAVLGYEIEENTAAAMRECRQLLRGIAAERIYSEFCKLVTGCGAGNIIRDYADIIGEFIPELMAMEGFQQHNPYHRYDVLEHCIRAMEAVKTNDDNRVYMKLAAIFHDIGKPETYSMDDNGIGHFYGHPAISCTLCRRILKRLKADAFTADRVCTIVKYHDLVFEKDPRILKRWMNRFSPEILFEILEIKKADNFATGNMGEELRIKFEDIGKLMTEILEEQQCFSMKDLAVSGRDVIAAGTSPGPEVGRILNSLLDDVMDEKIPNDRNKLLEQIQIMTDKKRTQETDQSVKNH